MPRRAVRGPWAKDAAGPGGQGKASARESDTRCPRFGGETESENLTTASEHACEGQPKPPAI
jgi:hypothetical protein